MLLSFPQSFTWGAATAAYQIEGAARTEGRGPSIWDTFSHTPGRVRNGDTGDLACDHYHRYEADVELMAQLGLGAYRFSISWPRVQPDGAGAVNRAGLDFYDRLVDALLERDITPYVTLYHWDLPQALADAGGWPDRRTAERYVDYVEVVQGALGDRVRHWTTFNEPWCSSFLGYACGFHAPGESDDQLGLAAAHHLLLAHGEAVRVLRAGDADAQCSITLNLAPVTAASEDPADREAARRVDGMQNRLFLEPVLRGAYPPDVLADCERLAELGFIRDGDEQLIGAGVDFLGINYYMGFQVAAEPEPRDPYPTPWPGAWDARFLPFSHPQTAMGWPIEPERLTELLVGLAREHPDVPLVITENGAAFGDDADPEGDVHDPERISFLRGHLQAAHTAIEQGVDLRGYFLWSLMDNFEWTEGYGKRFGIVHIDYPSQRRILKDSARWYAEVIGRGGVEVDGS